MIILYNFAAKIQAMKNKFLSFILLLILFIAPVIKSQGQAALLVLIFGDKAATENFNFSILSGVNLSNVTGLNDTKSLYGINFGLGVNMKLSDKFYLKPEFKPLSPKGFYGNSTLVRGEFADPNFTDVKTTRKLNYIDIPVLIHYQFIKKAQIGFGPQVSILTSANEKFEGLNGDNYEHSIYTKLNHTDFGLTTTLTYMLSTKRKGKGVNLQLRYYYGLNDVYKEGPSNKSSVFSFNIEFPFISEDIASKNIQN
jgi:hypothetical protein